MRELSILQELDHENIVKLLDIIWEETKILLVFELCRTDLKNLIYDDHKKDDIDMKTIKKNNEGVTSSNWILP